MADFKRNNKAITLIEIIIVILITSVIMGVGMAMMRRSNIQFKKSNDLISIQRLMDNIVERIRSDVRSLKKVKRFNQHEIEFYIFKGGEVKLDEDGTVPEGEIATHTGLISYQFDSEKRTLYRSEEGKESKSDFHGSNQIISLNFKPEFMDGESDLNESDDCENLEFKSLNISMQIAANEYSGKKTDSSTLSIACQFYSTCVESELRIYKNSEKGKK